LNSLTSIWVIPSRLLDIRINKIEAMARSILARATRRTARGAARFGELDEGCACKR